MKGSVVSLTSFQSFGIPPLLSFPIVFFNDTTSGLFLCVNVVSVCAPERHRVLIHCACGSETT